MILRVSSLVPCGLVLAAGLQAADYRERERNYWAFQPRAAVIAPATDSSWGSLPVDAFVLEQLLKKDLRPSEAADCSTLVRRIFLDVTGLPPSTEELTAFLVDTSDSAWERLVDRLLASPRYGEQGAQHWLDMVRFAETEGFEYDRYLPGLWRYRDYVINSLNADKPYDQFIREQLAGDEMIAGGPQLESNRELLIAAGLNRLAPVRRNAGNQEVASSRNEVLTERTDIVGTALLGLTVGCARCHDHMYDPIRQVDYYRLQAYFGASREVNIVFAGGMSIEEWQKQTKETAAKMKSLRSKIKLAEGEDHKKLQTEHDELEAQLPPPPPTLATIQNDTAEPTTIHVLNRGDFTKKGQAVNPRPLGVLLEDDVPTQPEDVAKPRSHLADWITKPDHPLTARVMVNRIWQVYFGQGIVKTANDFGFMGGRPSHPELLDYLANELVSGGWRLKRIHRMILTSSTYRQASKNIQGQSAAEEKDPDNKLLWRGPSRRMSAEEIRDSMLAASGNLNLGYGGKSIMLSVDNSLIDLMYDPTQWLVDPDPAQHNRRSIYLIAKRNLRLPFMEAFDQPAMLTSCARRETSTHAPQSLELLNGRIANNIATLFASRLDREAGDDPGKLVDRAYLLTTGRLPGSHEKELALTFLEHNPLHEFALAMFNLNSFLYVN